MERKRKQHYENANDEQLQWMGLEQGAENLARITQVLEVDLVWTRVVFGDESRCRQFHMHE